MSKGNKWELDLLEAIFYGSVAGVSGLLQSGTTTKFWVALHTATDLDAADQNSSEANYGGYVRVSVDRTSGDWAVTTGVSPAASPIAAITFATSTLSGTAIVAASVGTASAGAGYIWYYGSLTTISMNTSGITPILTTGSTISED